MPNEKPQDGDLRVWWVPQVPMQAFHAPVVDTAEAKRLLATLAQYDKFQFDNNIKPDYCNAGGLEVYQVDEDGHGGWFEWEDHETGDHIDTYDTSVDRAIEAMWARQEGAQL